MMSAFALPPTSFVAWKTQPTPLKLQGVLSCKMRKMVSSTLGHCCKDYVRGNVVYLNVLHICKFCLLVAHITYRWYAFNVKLSETCTPSQKQAMHFYRQSYWIKWFTFFHPVIQHLHEIPTIRTPFAATSTPLSPPLWLLSSRAFLSSSSSWI